MQRRSVGSGWVGGGGGGGGGGELFTQVNTVSMTSFSVEVCLRSAVGLFSIENPAKKNGFFMVPYNYT